MTTDGKEVRGKKKQNKTQKPHIFYLEESEAGSKKRLSHCVSLLHINERLLTLRSLENVHTFSFSFLFSFFLFPRRLSHM